MNTWPKACTISALRPRWSLMIVWPRPGASRAKFSGRTIRGSRSMKASMSF